MTQKTAALTAAALVGFAANSLLCRLALKAGAIDAASFTAIRLGAGAVVLTLVARVLGRWSEHSGSWVSAAALFMYAIAFSLSYRMIGATVGPLVLFGAVQITMIGWGIVRGERPSRVQWAGIALAVCGLVVLTLPGLTASPALGMGLMAAAGIAWGIYSLRGRASAHPLTTTAANFLRTLPMVAPTLALSLAAAPAHLTIKGVLLAASSGVIASGLGYALWYRALPGLTATQAASVQLLVPILAASAAVPILSEAVTLRLVVSAALVLGGIGLSIWTRALHESQRTNRISSGARVKRELRPRA